MLIVPIYKSAIGQYLPLVSEMRYLGIFVVKARSFRCSFSHSKRSFFDAVNGVFGKLLHLASEVVIQVLANTVIWIRMLQFAQCVYNRWTSHIINYLLNSLGQKALTQSQTVSIFCGAVLPSVLVLRKADKLALRYQCLENAFCTYCRSIYRVSLIAVLINLYMFYLLFIFLYSFRCICLPLGE